MFIVLFRFSFLPWSPCFLSVTFALVRAARWFFLYLPRRTLKHKFIRLKPFESWKWLLWCEVTFSDFVAIKFFCQSFNYNFHQSRQNLCSAPFLCCSFFFMRDCNIYNTGLFSIVPWNFHCRNCYFKKLETCGMKNA